MRRKGLGLWPLAWLILNMTAPIAVASGNDGALSLGSGWLVQSSCKVPEAGTEISSAAYQPKGWYSARAPSTILATLVEDGIYKDPYFGFNLRSIPGTTYPIDKIFSGLPMPKDSPFNCAWWYRTEFLAPAGYSGKEKWLDFQGINYRADVWLNGKRIASSSEVAGAYRTYEFNVTNIVIAGQPNILAVEVFAPTEKDLAINWVEWNPAPPDKDMGLWREVYLVASGPVALRRPQVISRVDTKTRARADLTVTAELQNATGRGLSGILKGRIGDVTFQQNVELAAHEVRKVAFSPGQFPQMTFLKPRLWWPRGMGDPNLYTLSLAFEINGTVSDRQELRFGIREVTGELDSKVHRLFRVNGIPILIRGAGWAPDMLLRENPTRLEQELRYVVDVGLNAIRLEGKLETDQFYDRTDELGILVMAGWCCCDIWEQWDQWTPETTRVAQNSLRSQVLRMRNHPSIFVWLNGSDKPPTTAAEEGYLKVLKEASWPNLVISSASGAPTKVSGPSGVKMTGPYDWVPPNYWLTDKGKFGGAYGFNTETCSGDDIPSPESLKKFIPARDLWPPFGPVWKYHASWEVKIDNFRDAMLARYGPPHSLEEFNARAQAMGYEGERAMFEAYSRNKYTSTGVIQWMLNNAWPGIMYHLYDYYLEPGGAYFGAKKANEPLHVMYSYDDRSIWIVNNAYVPAAKVKVKATVFDFALTKKSEKETTLDVETDGVLRAFTIPEIPELTTTYFLRLELMDPRGGITSENFYWLSTKPEMTDWDRIDGWHTPTKQYCDLTALARLPPVNLALRAEQQSSGARVWLKNESKSLAFMVHLRILKGRGGEELLPILWNDNYVAILPGEERQFTATYDASSLGQAVAWVGVDGWNISPNGSRVSAPN
jgi:exo-1,4-beta-D-glucosaminidase